MAIAGVLSVGLLASACGGSSSDTSSTASGASSGDCSAYTQYGDLSGKTISVSAGIVTPEDTAYIDSYKPFEDCTGAKVTYDGNKDFETQILVRARAGNPPDIAIVPQPGLVKQLVATGAAKPAPKAVADNVDKFWSPEWKAYTTVDGKYYGAPSGASVKSLVWYSPSEFKDSGYAVPTTLDELKTLSDKMVSDGKKPWCAGISSGEATGWPITDWMEDMMLRSAGPAEYDKWVNHQIAFNSAEPTKALDMVGEYLKNPAYVNGGLGDVTSIATTTFQDGGLPILDGTCSLHRQASFYAANWPKGTTVAEDGDVFAFYLPGKTAGDKPVLGGGEFNVAFSDRPEVQAFQTYLSTDTWANNKVAATPNGGWISANKGLDASKLSSPIDKLSADLLQDPKTVFRFDGSDQMPAAVGSNSFWKQATAWITGQSTKDTVDNIEASWPTS
ncbi:ABC transporter substrate-binding protein [Rhodococcus antarcticus]|jgi:alpha-glucoside transport system substrate-binding protein|uniref:ABC transporter substrate-binding protein n=1 Tax=Rhodococcus antarcticus TaxID=2987751 RepID=A0ABY6NWN6_9NOCA|nr:ABC transporter substrate-binding protein [Rhodococcus antarcticus]UZJ23441.1 ABC transporter substrate-binding protein [Rhodococcus antarcticus]